jgi:hypothetical protein
VAALGSVLAGVIQDVAEAGASPRAAFGPGDGFYSKISSLDEVVDRAFVDIERSIDPLTIVDVDLDGKFEMLYQTEEDNGLLLRSETPALDRGVSIHQEWVCPF